MTIVCAGYGHETNTFAVTPTVITDFRPPGEEFPSAESIAESSRATRTILGGCLDAAERLGVACRTPFRAFAQPSGLVTAACEQALLAELLRRVDAEPACDALILPLHGAMVSADNEDSEGHLISAVRERFGPDLPIVVTLDFHANLTAQMVAGADLIVGFDLYPHTDMYERGVEALELAVRLARREIRPVTAFCQLPLLTMPPKQCTLIEPMRQVLARLHAIESRPGVLTGTVAMGFPFADIRAAGVGVLVATDGDETAARAYAAELGALIWSLRQSFEPELTPIDAIIDYTYAEQRRPVLVADGSDNPGGGAPCDGTVLLQAMIAGDLRDAVLAALYDPETVDQAFAAGVGATIEARLGGKTDDRHGAPLACRAYVRLLADGRFTHRSEMSYGVRGNMGRTAVLQVGGVTVIVCSRRAQVWDPEYLRAVGVPPENARLLVLKSAVHYRAAFEPLADRVYDADTPGVHRPEFAGYDYQAVRRPIYPLDREVVFDAVTATVVP